MFVMSEEEYAKTKEMLACDIDYLCRVNDKENLSETYCMARKRMEKIFQYHWALLAEREAAAVKAAEPAEETYIQQEMFNQDK